MRVSRATKRLAPDPPIGAAVAPSWTGGLAVQNGLICRVTFSPDAGTDRSCVGKRRGSEFLCACGYALAVRLVCRIRAADMRLPVNSSRLEIPAISRSAGWFIVAARPWSARVRVIGMAARTRSGIFPRKGRELCGLSAHP